MTVTRRIVLSDRVRTSDADGMPPAAHMYTEQTTLIAQHADIPPPAERIGVSVRKEHGRQVSRYFRGTGAGVKARIDIPASRNDAVVGQGSHGGTAEPGRHGIGRERRNARRTEVLTSVRNHDTPRQALCRNLRLILLACSMFCSLISTRRSGEL